MKEQLKKSFSLSGTIESIYTGGKVRVSSDLERIYSTLGEDIIVSEFKNGKVLHTLKGDSEIITSFCISKDEKYLVSASRSLMLYIWDLTTYKIIRQFKSNDAPVICIEIDDSSTIVATGSADSSIKLYDIVGGFLTHQFKGHSGVISSLKFHKLSEANSNKLWLISGANDCNIKVWDLNKSKCLTTLINHGSVIRGLDISKDGSYLLSGSRDKVVNIWNLKKFELVKSIPVYESIENVGFLPKDCLKNAVEITNNELFFIGGETGLIKIYNFKDGKQVYQQPQFQAKQHSLTDLFINKQQKTITTISDDHNILTYSLEKDLSLIKQIVGYTDEIVDLKYIGSEQQGAGSYLGVACNSESFRIYNTEDLDCTLVSGHSDMVLVLATRSWSNIIATGSKDHSARIWQVDTSKGSPKVNCLAICSGHAEAVGAVAISNKSDHKHLMATGSQDRTIKLWDFTPALNKEENDEVYKPTSVYTFQAHDKDINTITFSPSDRYIATGSQDKTAKIWNTEDGALLGTLKGHKRGVWSVNFSEQNPVVATSSGDKTIKLWNINDFSCIRTFEGHSNSVLNVQFFSSGLQLISAGSDGLVKLWDVKTSECVTTLDNHEDKIWTLAIRPDEKVVVSGGADSVISFWNDTTEEEMEKERVKNETKVANEQKLSNCLVKKDYVKAIELCFELNHPAQLFRVLNQISENRELSDTSVTGSLKVDELFTKLNSQKLSKIIEFIKEWNTNGRFSHIAQSILYLILKHHSVEYLSSVSNIKENISALLPYTQRHYSKLDELITQSYLIDYTLLAMEKP
ncbi:WD40 repeat-like protein [Neoconidiobolus thromboides FSU 785]|nr:WD40 repeat-like protein [Neoconidiobolus thromboides FSU 785]